MGVDRDKRYGVKKMSKEENMRLKMRTEERLEIATAKTNFWRNHRRQGQGEEIWEEEAVAWENIKVGILILEEAEWIVKEDDMRLLNTNPTNQIILKSPILEVGEEQEAKRMEEGTKEELEEKSNILHPNKMENDSINVILEVGDEQEGCCWS